MFKILVVEDDAQLNKSVCTYLEQNGYEPFECLSAEEAYDAMYGGAVFDMIISDIMMPDIDGFEFAETVREVNSEIPILFMTARDDFASKQKGFRAGIDDYMVKPVDLDELLLRIGALLRRARIAAEKSSPWENSPSMRKNMQHIWTGRKYPLQSGNSIFCTSCFPILKKPSLVHSSWMNSGTATQIQVSGRLMYI